MNKLNKIVIGGDHAGFELKNIIINYLENKGIETIDAGPNSSESTDYPPFAHTVAEQVLKLSIPGILICGSGNGVNMTANKHQGIRSALCWNEEIAKMARQHNDANIMAMPARYLDTDTALKMVEVFLSTAFEGGRHQKRVDLINC